MRPRAPCSRQAVRPRGRGSVKIGQCPLLFVRRTDILLQRGSAISRAAAALLGRFLPRLGPLAPASGPFFLAGAVKPELDSANVLPKRYLDLEIGPHADGAPAGGSYVLAAELPC